jgi:hypothetical protein
MTFIVVLKLDVVLLPFTVHRYLKFPLLEKLKQVDRKKLGDTVVGGGGSLINSTDGSR